MKEQLQLKKNEETLPENGAQNWNDLYKIGGLAALISLVFFPIQIIVYLVNPPPDTILGLFTLMREKPAIGLIDLDLLLVVDQVLGMLVFLGLFVALKRTNRSLMAIGLVVGLISMILLIASNPACAMLNLSNQYFSATSDSVKAMILGAGQATMAAWQGTAFQVSYIIGALAALLISIVMLRSAAFSKATAIMGILANAIALGLYVPVVGVYISIFSVVFLWVWYLLSARALLRLAKATLGEAQ
jgi:hypothetical protein